MSICSNVFGVMLGVFAPLQHENICSDRSCGSGVVGANAGPTRLVFVLIILLSIVRILIIIIRSDRSDVVTPSWLAPMRARLGWCT